MIYDENRDFGIGILVVKMANKLGANIELPDIEDADDVNTAADEAIEWLNDESRQRHPTEPSHPGYYEWADGFWYHPQQ